MSTQYTTFAQIITELRRQQTVHHDLAIQFDALKKERGVSAKDIQFADILKRYGEAHRAALEEVIASLGVLALVQPGAEVADVVKALAK